MTFDDHDHLRDHAQRLFPCAMIKVSHTEDETIHIDVNDHRFTFEIGSDNDDYNFSDGRETFLIPLMDNLEDI